MKSYKDIIAGLLKWHREDRQHNLRRAFELGDMLNLGILHTGLTEYELIRRLRDDLGELAYGITTYNRAARISRVFTRNQRKMLIEKYISLEKAEMLAGQRFEGRKRVQMVANIKSGKTKSKDILSRKALCADADLIGEVRGRERGNVHEYLCNIVLKGDENNDQCEAAVASLFSALRRMGQPVKQLADLALNRIAKI